MKKAIMIILGISLFLEAGQYRNNSKGIVTDSITKLQWQDDYRPHNPEIRYASWEDAIDYCNDLTLGGYSDWRLPNINELSSIVIYGKTPSINNVFVYIKSVYYWASTTNANASSDAWMIDFDGGRQDNDHSKNGYSAAHVRCVRG